MSLRVENVAAGYGERSVIEGISFAVESGQIMGLFGHNGAGKSTTLRAILGMLPLRAGHVWLDGAPLDRLPLGERIERGLRLLPEGRGVFPELTVAENLAVVVAANGGKGAGGETADEIFELFPVLAEKRKATASSLSGGQQQMLAFGLATIGRPRCILLEEPSVGLQPDIVDHLFEEIERICRERGMCAVLIEHKIAAALKIVDHVLILNNGKPVFQGSREATRQTDIWQYF